MKFSHFAAAALLSAAAPALAEKPAAAPAVVPAAAAEKIPPVEDAVPDAVKKLPPPGFRDFTNGIRMAVSSATENAQQHVLQGLNNLHGGWEFEAMRHFASALKEDPECLLAHWGLVMCMLAPSPETDAARAAATERMISLIENGAGTELERGYCYGLVKYGAEGPVAAANAFRKVADRFPNDMQAAVFASLFGRGGYDTTGEPNPGETAEQAKLLDLVRKNPDDPLPLNALLFTRAEGPNPTESLEMARRLCELAPDYPPYFHILGHYAWRCGEHNEAISALGRASAYYQRWMKENKVTAADCPEWLKAECYRVIALNSKGDFDTARAVAEQIAAVSLPKDRPNSPGMRFLLWDAKTLPARIVLARNLPDTAAADAAAALPAPEALAPIRKTSAAFVWIDGLRLCLEARKQINAKDYDGARATVAALTTHGEMMTRTRPHAHRSGESSAWLRAFRALEILTGELRGELAMAGPEEGRNAAYNWFAAAADRQKPAPMLFPPLVLSPMARHLGDFYRTKGNREDAISAYERALETFPSDLTTLNELLSLYRKNGDSAKAAATEQRITALKEL